MTRETKIGLLVGLAFIIVIGILLSDHINTTSDPARASITDAGSNVRDSVNAPGTERSNDRVSAVVVPNRVEPSIPVQTQSEPQQQPRQGATIVDISGGDPSQVQLPRRDTRQSQTAQSPTNDSNIQVGPPDNGETAQVTSNDSRVPENLQQAARRNGQELVAPGNNDPVGIHPTGGASQTNTASNTSRGGLPPGFREVKAEQNDSVSRLAAKYLGASNKANREAIIKANPSLQNEPHMVIAGKNYVIPPAAAATPVQPAPQAPQTAQKAPAPAPQPAAGFYTVKENDNLWKIAAEQLGSGNRWTEIRDLNQDVLKGGDGLQVNMRLKLPPKAVASNN